MKKGCRFSFVVLIVVLSVHASAGGKARALVSTNSATKCEQLLNPQPASTTPATLLNLRALYYKAEAQSLPQEQQPMARALYQQTLRTVAAAYATTMEQLHTWVISAEGQSPQITVNASHSTPRTIFYPHVKHALHGHVDFVYEVAFSPDSKRVVTNSNNAAQLWDVTTGQKIFTLTKDGASISSIAFSADGSKIITTTGHQTMSTQLWDALTGKEIHEFNGNGTLSPDGTKIITITSYVGVAQIWDAITHKEILTLTGHKDRISNASFSADSKRVITSSQDGTVRIWNAEPPRGIITRIFGAVKRKANHILTNDGRPVSKGIFSPDGTKILTTSNNNSDSYVQTVQIWNATTGKEICKLSDHTCRLKAATFPSEGTKVIIASDDNTVRTWDTTTGQVLFTFTVPQQFLHKPTFSTDSAKIFVRPWDVRPQIWDTETGKMLFAAKILRNDIYLATFSPDGTKIIAGSSDKYTQIWDLYVTEDKFLSILNSEEDAL